MEYKCVDAGSRRCPCVLMEAGQCYMCTMSRTGKCSCGTEWKGTCPYTEHVLGGLKTVGLLKPFRARVADFVDYSGQLKVIRLDVPAGFAQQCSKGGSYILAESRGCKVPLSVLRTGVSDETGSNFVEFAVQPAGPKTIDILRPDVAVWQISGPFAAGLSGLDRLRPEEPLLVIAKGTAIAPYINMMSGLKGKLMIDDEKLTGDFLHKYVGDCYEPVRLYDEMERVATAIDKYRQIMFLASPYYTEKIFEMRPERKDDIIIANHASICCGVGICGACSYTDKDGVTVRRCKCGDTYY